MNKSDLKLILILLTISLLILLIFKISQKESTNFMVYYENDLILKENLNIDKIYEVNGYNGIVKIEVKNGKIRVIEENSPLHLCSKQGYISATFESIICLPNKIIIKIDNSTLDGVVG